MSSQAKRLEASPGRSIWFYGFGIASVYGEPGQVKIHFFIMFYPLLPQDSHLLDGVKL